MNKKLLLAVLAVLIAAAAALYYFNRPKAPLWEDVKVEQEAFTVTVPSSGTVEPENKITITAPIAGRIDKILFEEGAKVGRRQVIAWMSSTDRAALLDSAQVQGAKEAGDWAEVYKPTPILSPASGVIIAKHIVVGQTVTQQTALFELSDRLVIVADVDETDLGKIKLGQEAAITVDSFPDMKVTAKVIRIAHQSQLKNSINTYEVLLHAEKMPVEFRAGLTASVQFVFERKESALLLPTWVAEGRENFELELQVKGANGPEKRSVKLGLSNGQKIEVVSGLNPGDVVQVKSQSVLGDKPGSVFNMGGPGARGRGRR